MERLITLTQPQLKNVSQALSAHLHQEISKDQKSFKIE
jgi:hypothetical protein